MRTIISIMILILINQFNYSQDYRINDYVDPTFHLTSQFPSSSGTGEPTVIREALIIAVDQDANSTLLPAWFNPLMGGIGNFFYASTFGRFEYIVDVIRLDADNAFRMPIFRPEDEFFTGDCEHVHYIANMIDVINQADVLYDFNNYDYDSDGIVELHFASLGSPRGGAVGFCLTHTITDISQSTGNPIQVTVAIQTRGSYEDENRFKDVFYHEVGHNQFNFPDMDHNNDGVFAHYGIGGFDVMSGGGWNGKPSPYNPFFRHLRGWYTPTQITTSQNNVVLNDFQMSGGDCYLYQPSSIPAYAAQNQRFYISLHKFDLANNPLYSEYPFADRQKGGVLIWHSRVTTVTTGTTNAFQNYYFMPLDIESAHGKTIWNETDTDVIDTGIEDPLNGQDKLEIRKRILEDGDWIQIAGPYFGQAAGDGTVFYTPDYGQDFTALTNPNSNFYFDNANEHYPQSVTSGFSIENIRMDAGQVKADFKINEDILVNQNLTLPVGRWYFEHNLIVSNGNTLTINEGTELIFNNGTYLEINGHLQVNGTVNGNVVLDFGSPNSGTQNGIKINSGGTTSISYANISNAYNGIKIIPNSSQSTIQNCTVEDCYDGILVQYGSKDADLLISGNTIQDNTHYGISITNSGYGMNEEPTVSSNTITGSSSHGLYLYDIENLATISGNTISNNTGSGIAMYYSSPYVTGNEVDNNYNGIGCGNASAPDMDNNDIENNDNIGVYSISSNPFLGQAIPSIDGGNNTIAGNTFRNLQAESSSNIMAQHNWWGADPPDANKIVALSGSSIDYDPWLEEPPGAKLAAGNFVASGSNQVQDNFDPGWGLMRKILYAKGLIKNKNYNTAQNLLKDIISTYPDSSLSFYAINLLWNSYRNNNVDQLKSFLYSLTSKNEDKEVYGFADIILAQYEKDNTPKSLDKIIEKYSSKNIKQMSLFGKFLYYMNVSGNKDMARLVSVEIDNQYPGSYISEDAHIQLGDKESPGNKPVSEDKVIAKTDENLPREFLLSDNYPNPFNPSTTITFSLPKKEHVVLKVFDVLGNEVLELVNETREAGTYRVDFDAADLASGVYIYILRATGFVQSKKMLVMK